MESMKPSLQAFDGRRRATFITSASSDILMPITKRSGGRIHEVYFTRDSGDQWSFKFSDDIHDIQGVLYEISESIANSPTRAERRLKSIIHRHPYAFDAYDQLAFIYDYGQRQPELVLNVLEAGLARARELFPEEFVLGEGRVPWSILENRPFLRMYERMGLELSKLGKVDMARDVFKALIGMNPEDNQGVRELLCSCYFRLAEYSSVLELCRMYDGDTMAAISFGRILALLKLGRRRNAKSALRTAAMWRPNIAQEIMASRHRKPHDLSSPYELGSKREAELFWNDFGDYWDEAAVSFVREEAGKGGSISR